VISGGITGAGAATKFSAVRWGVAGNIVTAWLLTLPAAGGFGAAIYGLCTLFGHGATGPVVVTIALLAALAVVFARRLQQAGPAPVTP
jgi:PiT family inorganic phosphate transporter